MKYFIKFEILDLSKKDLFYKKIYSCLNSNYNYSGIIIVNYLDNTKDKFSFTYISNISIIMSYVNNKSECSLEYLYYLIKFIISISNKNILNIELKFIRK
jgi:hypothetical protein